MQRSFFIAIFVGIHIAFVLLLIAKQSRFIELSYEKQRQEQLLRDLSHRKNELQQQLYQQTNPTTIAKRATSELAMKPLRLKQIRQVPT